MEKKEQKQEISPEEKAKTLEKLRTDRVNNLESLLQYAGSNYLKTEVPYGKEGSDAGNLGFNNYLMSEKAGEIKNQIYSQKVKESQEMQKALGYNTISAPEYNVTNHELEMATLGLISDAQTHLNLKDLGEVVKKIAPGLKEKIDLIPSELKGISYASIAQKIKKAQEGKMNYAPTMEEEAFISFYSPLTQAYKKFAGLNMLNQSTTQNYNAHFDQILEGYKQMKEEASKKENTKK